VRPSRLFTFQGVGSSETLSAISAQSSQEIASPGTLVRTIVAEALALVAVGLGIGRAGALALTRTLESQLFGVSAADPVAFVGVTLILGATALLASMIRPGEPHRSIR
jgi:hypothetical protein